MNSWVTLLATVAGAVIAFVGHGLGRRSETRARRAELVLDQCAQLVTMHEDLRHRVWEEAALHRADRVEGWDLPAARLAMARIELLSTDQHLLAAVQDLAEAGRELGGYWRTGHREPGQLTGLRDRHRSAMRALTNAGAIATRPANT